MCVGRVVRAVENVGDAVSLQPSQVPSFVLIAKDNLGRDLRRLFAVIRCPRVGMEPECSQPLLLRAPTAVVSCQLSNYLSFRLRLQRDAAQAEPLRHGALARPLLLPHRYLLLVPIPHTDLPPPFDMLARLPQRHALECDEQRHRDGCRTIDSHKAMQEHCSLALLASHRRGATPAPLLVW